MTSRLSFNSLIYDCTSRLLDLIYPDSLYCICCNKIIDPSRTYHLCNNCMDEIKWAVGRTCSKCGKRLSQADPRDTCFSCSEHSHIFRRGYTCAEYGMHERAIIYKLKYDSGTYIADVLGEIMNDRFQSLELDGEYDILLPAPAHRTRLLSRGYNQAALIADALSSRCGIESSDAVLLRTSHTRALRSLTPEERRSTLSGVFAINSRNADSITGRRILLIDDIYTTGATADALASVLYEAGAACVDIMSFASGADVVK